MPPPRRFTMVRTQVQLTEEQARALKRLAARRHVSIATLVRAGVDELLKSSGDISSEERKRRAVAVAGKYRSGGSDLSSEHDEHLGEAFGS
jgi:Arc/MetJ-type ribon-helix-helix transcriptional regulator